MTATNTTDNANPLPPATGDRATVLYIGGLGRSGSTLLNDLVAQHKEVISVGEVNRLLDRGLLDDQTCGCTHPFSTCELWTRVGERLGGWDNLDPHELLRQRDAIDRNRHIHKLLFPERFPNATIPLEGYGEWYGKMLVAVRDSSEASVVIDSTKAISNALLLRHLNMIDLRLVHLVRDSRGVAYSWTKAQKKAEQGDDRMMDQFHPAHMAWRWLTWNTLFANFDKIGVPVLRVRYEDLIADPQDTVERVLAFGGLEKTELDFIDGQTITLEPTHSIAGNPSRFKTGEMELRPDEAWRTELDPKESKLVSTITYPLLRKYGYE